MALTITSVKKSVWGDRRVHIATITFDASYPAGGESLTAADLGFSHSLEAVFCEGLAAKNDETLAVGVKYDYTASKLVAYETAAAAEGPLAQVDDTESLASYEVRVLAIGY